MDFKKYADMSAGGLSVFSGREPGEPGPAEEPKAPPSRDEAPGMDSDYEIVYRSFKRNPPQGVLSALNAQKELLDEQVRIARSVCDGLYGDRPQDLDRFYEDFLEMERERARKASDLAMLLLGTSGGIIEDRRRAEERVFDALGEIGGMAVEPEGL